MHWHTNFFKIGKKSINLRWTDLETENQTTSFWLHPHFRNRYKRYSVYISHISKRTYFIHQANNDSGVILGTSPYSLPSMFLFACYTRKIIQFICSIPNQYIFLQAHSNSLQSEVKTSYCLCIYGLSCHINSKRTCILK